MLFQKINIFKAVYNWMCVLYLHNINTNSKLEFKIVFTLLSNCQVQSTLLNVFPRSLSSCTL